MKGDFSRNTFDPAKHFLRVLMQQGRVQLDADWNEQVSILLHYLQTLATDLIGPYGGPAGNMGFEIIGENGDKSTGGNFFIGGGRYYVDGILCENKEQINYPSPLDLVKGKNYLVYLDVWEQHITALEDDSVREKALGGADTASRSKVVWQVKVEQGDTPSDTIRLFTGCDNVRKSWGILINLWQPRNRGLLKVQAKRPEEKGPCLIPPDAKYRGAENHLYRVEIHQGSDPKSNDKLKGVTFKWSRENGSIVTGCKNEGGKLIVDNPRDFTPNDWVELINDEQESRGEPGIIAKLISIDGNELSLASMPNRPAGLPDEEEWPTKVRRWDMRDDIVAVTESTGETGWIALDNGIQIQFQPAINNEHHTYRSGDYWLIPARTATTTGVEWLAETVAPPHGIEHHYAPLAVLSPATAATANGLWTIQDCRCSFGPLRNNCSQP